MIRTTLKTGAILAILCTPLFAAPTEVTVNDTGVFPESITSTASGSVIFGSSAKPIIYRSLPGAAVAEPWIHLAGKGIVTTAGVLADPASGTLWACVRETEPLPAPAAPPAAGATPPQPVQHSFLRAFNLTSGALKGNYPMPGDTGSCNDMTVMPDGAIILTDPANMRLDRLAPGAKALDVWFEDKEALNGLDGVDVMDGKVYANNIRTGKIYRVTPGDGGKLGAAVEIQVTPALTGPDGMRSAGGKMYVADNRGNQVAVLTFHGDAASATVLKTGLQTPTAVSPTGDTLWIGESKFNYRRDPSLGDPNPFKAYALPLPR